MRRPSSWEGGALHRTPRPHRPIPAWWDLVVRDNPPHERRTVNPLIAPTRYNSSTLLKAVLGRQTPRVPAIRFKDPSVVLQGLTPAEVTAAKHVAGVTA